MTDHFELSIIIGTRAISGSEAIMFKNRCMHAAESSMASSMLTSMICAPFSTCCRATATASSYFSSRISRAKALLPVTFARSPTFTNKDSSSIFKASRPDKRVLTEMSGTTRIGNDVTFAAMASMCSGVVPQQPPAILTSPARANSSSKAEVSAGVSSKPVSLMGFGKPALGYTQT